MPVMDGFEATAAIRALPAEEGGRIPIIALTADAFSENVTACLEAGMNAHVPKPFHEDELIQTIANVLRRKK